MVSLKIEDGALKTEGDYEFHVSNVHYNPDTNKSVMLITFYHSPEKPETAHNDQCIEVLAEKLKQDFISFNKNKFNSSANYQKTHNVENKKTFKELFAGTGIEPTKDENGGVHYEFNATLKNEDGKPFVNTMPMIETIVGNDGFEFDHNSTIPKPKGLCNAKSIYGSRELTVDERMHLWFVDKKPNRDVCDSVDELSDEEKHKYFDECNITRTIQIDIPTITNK